MQLFFEEEIGSIQKSPDGANAHPDNPSNYELFSDLSYYDFLRVAIPLEVIDSGGEACELLVVSSRGTCFLPHFLSGAIVKAQLCGFKKL